MAMAKVKNVNKIECTLEFTMSLEDWKQISKTLGSNECYAEIQMMDEIRDLVTQLEQTYYSAGLNGLHEN